MKSRSLVPQALSSALLAAAMVAALSSCQAGESGRTATPARQDIVAKPGVATSTPAKDTTKQELATIVIYYFHGTARCPSCIKIEKYTTEAVFASFSAEVKKGLLEMKVVNVDESGNGHFVEDYKLYTKSVIVSRTKAGTQQQWKNLDKVWTLLGDERGFKDYVTKEIRAYL